MKQLVLPVRAICNHRPWKKVMIHMEILSHYEDLTISEALEKNSESMISALHVRDEFCLDIVYQNRKKLLQLRAILKDHEGKTVSQLLEEAEKDVAPSCGKAEG